MKYKMVPYSLLSDEDVTNFKNGTHYQIYNQFGSHSIQVDGEWGIQFCVWAPNATAVYVMGHFNNWKNNQHRLFPRFDKSGIWEGFIPNLKLGEAYKYHIEAPKKITVDKTDPVGFYSEKRPDTASITWDMYFEWKDQEWMEKRKAHNALNAPWSVYEVHLGSWQRPDKNDESSFNTYDQLIDRLVPYVKGMGFTHVELMPITEFPFDGSWGYQCTGYFAATSRFGDPQGLMRLIDAFHQNDIGVILDWVPSHFPKDMHGLFLFDGTHTYEYADMRKGYHPDWNSYIFNYKRGEVKSFLISSARFWLDYFHIDGIRVDAVSSMLKLDYSRKEGEWEPNELGGNENLEAIAFIKDLNETLYRDFPDIQTIAEESTDWKGVTALTTEGGLGFGMKWMMGWMHDTINFFKKDPLHRKHHQDDFTFSMMYYYDENFMLALSHDEVVHGKSPMLYKMFGDEKEKFASLRLLYTYMWTHPGAKLLFMGNEFGQSSEWNYTTELDWPLLQYDSHNKLQDCVKTLNYILRSEPAMHLYQFEEKGFEWVDLSHPDESIIVYKRKAKKRSDDLLVVLNLTPVERIDWEITVKGKKYRKEIFNTDDAKFWGTNTIRNLKLNATLIESKSKTYNLKINIPPLGGLILK